MIEQKKLFPELMTIVCSIFILRTGIRPRKYKLMKSTSHDHKKNMPLVLLKIYLKAMEQPKNEVVDAPCINAFKN